MQAGSYRPFGARRTVLLLLVAIGVYDLLGRWLSLPLYPVGGCSTSVSAGMWPFSWPPYSSDGSPAIGLGWLV
jgi:hypothetical protein